ncbi:MAG: RNA-binding S4 domain-containing protein [Gudongella sp.]|jgi:ribosomal 50S subunit-recycling heat shock protein|nr:RNA-binding S4 domain-containing protein [Gudongella sp.]
MRIDKYLKVARIIKRRTVAKEACEQGRVTINEKTAKPGDEVKVGDIINIRFGSGEMKLEVIDVKESVGKDGATSLYKVIE